MYQIFAGIVKYMHSGPVWLMYPMASRGYWLFGGSFRNVCYFKIAKLIVCKL